MSSTEPNKESEPSMLGGHVKYVQGAISSLLGNESTGEQTKSEAVQEMRDANSASNTSDSGPDQPTQSNVLGSVEGTLGKAFGCEGMEKEGEARKTKAGVEETSGLG